MKDNQIISWTLAPNALPDSLEAKQPEIDNGVDRRSADRYFDKDIMDKEWECMWTKTWLLAGASSDLQRPGSYFTFNIRHESFVIVRAADQSINAYYNVCPHRGNKLVLKERGMLPQFTCSFHSWQFDHYGKNIKITDKETFKPETLTPCPKLTSVACEEYAGLVFISMNDNPPDLHDTIGLPAGYLETYKIDQMIAARHTQSTWAANWKIGVDAFYESYHLHAVHPETSSMMADLHVQYDLYKNGASRMIVPFGEPSPRLADQTSVNNGLKYLLASVGIDPETFTGDATDVRKALSKAKRAIAEKNGLDVSKFSDNQLIDSWATGIFPNVQIGCHLEGVFLMRFLPHPDNPEQFIYDNITMVKPATETGLHVPDWMGLPEDADLTGATRPVVEHTPLGVNIDLGLVLNQDAFLLPHVQRGIKSKGFKGAIFSEQECRLRHFHTELDQYLNGSK